MSAILEEYLRLEHEMLRLDELSSPDADDLRDIMDLIWRKLTLKEKAILNERSVVFRNARPRLRLHVNRELLFSVPTQGPMKPSPAKRLMLSESDAWCTT